MMTLAKPAGKARAEVLGVPVDCLTMEETVQVLESFIASKEPHIVVTADSSGLVIAESDPEFKAILKSDDLVTPDSAGVVWACRRKGQQLEGRVSGVDIVA